MFKADNPFTFNLQLFAEGDPAASPAPADPAPAAPVSTEQVVDPRESMSLNDYFTQQRSQASEPVTPPTMDPGQVNPAQAAPTATPEPTEPRIDIPDKFRNPDGSPNMEAILKSHSELEKVLGRQGQELGQLRAMAEKGTNPAPETKPEPTPEELAAKEEAYAEEWFDAIQTGDFNKAMEVMEKRQQDKAEAQALQKQKDQEQAMGYLDAIAQAFPEEAEANMPMIKEAFDMMGDAGDVLYDALASVGINPAAAVLSLVKMGQATIKAPEAPKIPTLEEMLQDQTNVSKILQNPEIKKAILQNHMEEIKGNPTPPVIGNGPGGLPPSAQPVDLTNMKTAKEAFVAKYRNMSIGS